MQRQGDGQLSGSEFLMHTPCDKCGSSDANSLYSDGHTYCFACETYGQSQEEAKVSEKVRGVDFFKFNHEVLIKRCLTQKTVEFWDYTVGKYNGKTAQVANHKTPNGEIVGQKIRSAGKEFSVRGNLKEAGLYGQWLWRDKGKSITCLLYTSDAADE